LNENNAREEMIKDDIEYITKQGGDIYEVADYLENLGFEEGGSTALKDNQTGKTEITTFYKDSGSNMSVGVTHEPLYKGGMVLGTRFTYGGGTRNKLESVRRKRIVKESAKTEKFEKILDMLSGLGYEGNVNIVEADLSKGKTVGTVKIFRSSYRIDSDTYDEDDILNATCLGLSQKNGGAIDRFYISI
jgi:hypothetical protein